MDDVPPYPMYRSTNQPLLQSTPDHTFSSSAASNFPDRHTSKIMEQQRAMLQCKIDDPAPEDRELFRGVQMQKVILRDEDRVDDGRTGGKGSSNVSRISAPDVGAQFRYINCDDNGNPLPGGCSRWTFAHVVTIIGKNEGDALVDISSDDFNVVHFDGFDKRYKTLKELLRNLKQLYPAENFVLPKVGVDRVAVSHRMTFIPTPDNPKWKTEIRYVAYGYDTVDAQTPKNLVFLGNTMDISVFSEEPGAKVGYQPFYPKLMRGHPKDDAFRPRCYATDLSRTNRKNADMATETRNKESITVTTRGKENMQVKVGPVTNAPSSSCAMHICVGLCDRPATPPAPPPPPSRQPPPPPRAAVYRKSLCPTDTIDYEEWEEDQDGPNNSDDDLEPPPPTDTRVPRQSARLQGSDDTEGRIGIGTYVCDAKEIPHKSPVATGAAAIATMMHVVTTEHSLAITYERLKEAVKQLRQKYKETADLGHFVDECVEDTATVDAAKTTEGPPLKKAKLNAEMTAASPPVIIGLPS